MRGISNMARVINGTQKISSTNSTSYKVSKKFDIKKKKWHKAISWQTPYGAY